ARTTSSGARTTRTRTASGRTRAAHSGRTWSGSRSGCRRRSRARTRLVSTTSSKGTVMAPSGIEIPSLKGKVSEQEWAVRVDQAGFVIHSAIHAARHDARCVLHTHTVSGIAVSTQRAGLLPISQHAMSVIPSLGYHDFEGIATRDDEKPRLVADLGDHTHLILRNHGLITVGETVADAFVAMYFLESSCAIQVRAQSGGGELIPVPKDVLDAAYAGPARPRGRGETIWPGLLRRLDRIDPSYKT